MLKYKELWKAHEINPGETLELCLGSLHVWIYRGEKEWHIAHELNEEGRDRCSVSITNEGFDPSLDWNRWILSEEVNEVHFSPTLPNRPLLVRPEMPMSIMPKQSVQLFVGIPLWLRIQFGSKSGELIEVPSVGLSNSWFGSVTDGELCYALKTSAKLREADLMMNAHHAIFPLTIRNLSQDILHFERLCLRPQFLSVFEGQSRLWTNKGRVSYRGEDSWSRMVYGEMAPEFDNASVKLGKAREVRTRGTLLNTFDQFKQKGDV